MKLAPLPGPLPQPRRHRTRRPSSLLRQTVGGLSLAALVLTGMTATGQTLVVDQTNGNSPYAVNGNGTFANVIVGDTTTCVINQGDGNFVVTSGLTLGSGGGSTGTYNLNTSGTLTTGGIIQGKGTGTFNFNGGILRASASNGKFLTNVSNVFVQTGGAIIDADIYSVTVLSLQHGGAAGATDGGLTVRGTSPGGLTLLGTNTYNGGTTFASGTANLGSAGALGTTGTLSFTGGTLQYSAANTTDYSSRLSFATGQAFRIDTNGQNVTFAGGGIGGSGASLTKLGAGTLTLAGVQNNLSGGVTLAGGVLNLGNSLALQSANTINFTGGTLQYSAVNAADYSGKFSAAASQQYAIDTNGRDVTFATGLASSGGRLTKSGAGTLTLTGNNAYTGPTTVTGGTLTITGGSVGTSASTGAFSVSGGGAANLSGGQLFTGAATVGDGGTGTFAQSGGSFATKGNALTVGNGSTGNGAYTLSGASSSLSTGAVTIGIFGTGTFTQNGGTFTTNGNSLNVGVNAGGKGTYTLNGGSLSTGGVFGGNTTFVQSGGTFTTNGQTLDLGYFTTARGSYALSGGLLTTGETRVGGGSNSAGTFTQTGGTHTTNTLNLSGLFSSSASGTYTLGSGTLNVGMVVNGSGTGTFNFNGGTLQAVAGSTTFFQRVTTANVQSGGTTGTGVGGARIDTNGFDVTVAQNLVHDTANGAAATDGGLTKLGTGTLRLTGTANSYTGPTAVSAGTLAVSGALTGTGMLTVASGGTLAGRGTVAGGVTVQAGGTLSPGDLGTGVLTLGSSLTLNGTGLAAFTIGGSPGMLTNTQVDVGGQINLGGATLVVTLGSSYTPAVGDKFFLFDSLSALPVTSTFGNGTTYTQGGVSYRLSYTDNDPANGGVASPKGAGTNLFGASNDISLTVVAVPEPGTWALLATGLVIVGWAMRTQQRHAA